MRKRSARGRRRRRHADLVIDHAQAFPSTCLPCDGEEEVPAARRVDPAGAQDHAAATGTEDRLLARQLAGAVGVLRVWRIVLAVGRLLRAVEDIVRRVVHQQRAQSLRFLGEHAWGLGIDPRRQRFLRFGLVHRGMRGGVDDDAELRLAHHAADGVLVAKIQLGAAGGDHLAQRRKGAFQFPADLAVAARQQDPHAKVSAAVRVRPRRSLSVITGSPANGQGMPSAASFQSSVRSCSGA